jgi:tetratricopeptide (TPR) repeat protein
MSQGRVREALEFAEKAIICSRTLGSITFEADATHHLGVIHFQSGQLTIARNFMEDALGQMRDVGDPYREARMLSTLLGVYAMLGDTSAAESVVPKIEALLKVAPNPLVVGFTAQAKGLVALHLGNPNRARELFKTAETFARDHSFSEFLCMNLLAQAPLQKRPKPLLEEALELATKSGFRLREYQIRLQLGDDGANEVLEFLRANAPEGWF